MKSSTTIAKPVANRNRRRRPTLAVSVTAALAAVAAISARADAVPAYTFKVLASFASGNPIEDPQGDLVTNAAGNVYGTGNSVFVLPVGNRTPTVVASLSQSTTGANPSAGVTLDRSGNIYGTAYAGGANGYGTVFEVPAGSSTPTLLATFDGSTTGGLSLARPVLDAAGDLFGTTSYGGTGGAGTAWELPAGGHALQTLVAFNGGNGASPRSGLTADAAGDLFGTTYGLTTGNTAYNDGTLFEIAAKTHAFSTLVAFNGANGARPAGALLADAAGDLFGTTAGGQGGPLTYGTVFELPAGTTTVKTLATFSAYTGTPPQTGLAMDAAGDLFGATPNFGPGSIGGTVWELPAGGSTIQVIAALTNLNNGVTGYYPSGGVALDAAGDVFGTANEGGDPGPQGTVFELTPVAVPEPAAAAVVGVGIVAAVRRRPFPRR